MEKPLVQRRKPRRVDNESRGLVNCHTVTATTMRQPKEGPEHPGDNAPHASATGEAYEVRRRRKASHKHENPPEQKKRIEEVVCEASLSYAQHTPQ